MNKRQKKHALTVDYNKTMKLYKKEVQRCKQDHKCKKNDMVDVQKCKDCHWGHLGVCMKLQEHQLAYFGLA